jgi:hypothetical protein
MTLTDALQAICAGEWHPHPDRWVRYEGDAPGWAVSGPFCGVYTLRYASGGYEQQGEATSLEELVRVAGGFRAAAAAMRAEMECLAWVAGSGEGEADE